MDPLEKAVDRAWHETKVQAAIRAERERCAKVAEGWLAIFGDQKPEHVSAQKWATDAVRDIIDAIRSPEAK